MEQGDDTDEDDDDEAGDDGNSQMRTNNSAAVSNQTQQHNDAIPATVPAESQDCDAKSVWLHLEIPALPSFRVAMRDFAWHVQIP